jgi:hypothetical protein
VDPVEVHGQQPAVWEANGMDPSPTLHCGAVQGTIGAMATIQTQGRVQHAGDNGGY